MFHHPKELQALLKAGKKPSQITYDLVQGEIAANSGFDMTTEGKSKDDILLQEDLITLMPMIHEANAISEELNKKVSYIPFKGCCGCVPNTILYIFYHFPLLSPLYQMVFEILLVSPQARGLKEGRTEVKVKMRSLVKDHTWIWNRNQFLDRKYQMQEMYQNYVEGDEWDLPNVSHMNVT